MSQIASRITRFAPSPAPDVAGYRLYYGPSPHTMAYDGPFVDLGVPPQEGDRHVIDLAAYPALGSLPEGNYDLAIVAYDDVGNLSDFAEAENIPLDVEVPAAPGMPELD